MMRPFITFTYFFSLTKKLGSSLQHQGPGCKPLKLPGGGDRKKQKGTEVTKTNTQSRH